MEHTAGTRWMLRGAAYAVAAFIIIPILVVIGSSLTTTRYVTFPPVGVSLEWYGAALSDPKITGALQVSLTIAAATALISTTLGLAASFALERSTFRGKSLITALLMAPLAVPAIVLALGMVFFMTTIGLIRTVQGLVLGHLVVALPYAIRALSTALVGVDSDLEQSAAILGASPLAILVKITLPLMRSGIVAALMFSFLASFNNVTISLFLVGLRTQTLPIAIFRLSEFSLLPSLSAIATVVMAMTAVTMFLMEKKFGIYTLLEKGRSL
jgi:putative spermidine/putrescine transport system permease protein